MCLITFRNNSREVIEYVYKEYLKDFGFKYNKEICLVTKKLKSGTIRISYDWDNGKFIGWSLLIWNNEFEIIYRDIFLTSTEFDVQEFEISYNKAKSYLQQYNKK